MCYYTAISLKLQGKAASALCISAYGEKIGLMGKCITHGILHKCYVASKSS